MTQKYYLSRFTSLFQMFSYGLVLITDFPSDQFHQPWVLNEIPTPSTSLNDHEILLKVAVASFCHTDSMVLNGTFHDQPSGLAGSHEPSGTIVALGTGAAKHFSINDRIIAIGIQGPCGDCMDCNGPEEFRLSCKFNKGYSGISLPGAFQEYTIVDHRFAVRIPDQLSFVRAAPLTCAGCTSWRAIKRSGVSSGGWLGIVGSGGGLGHLAVQFAKKLGMNVIGIDAKDAGLELTRKAGADGTVDVREGVDAVIRQVHQIIGQREAGRGSDLCDAVLNLSDAKSAVRTSMMVTKAHGLVVQVAQPDQVEFPFQGMIFRDIRIMGSNLSSREELQELVGFVVANDIEMHLRTYHELESLTRMYEDVGSGLVAGKCVVVIDNTQVNIGA